MVSMDITTDDAVMDIVENVCENSHIDGITTNSFTDGFGKTTVQLKTRIDGKKYGIEFMLSERLLTETEEPMQIVRSNAEESVRKLEEEMYTVISHETHRVRLNLKTENSAQCLMCGERVSLSDLVDYCMNGTMSMMDDWIDPSALDTVTKEMLLQALLREKECSQSGCPSTGSQHVHNASTPKDLSG